MDINLGLAKSSNSPFDNLNSLTLQDFEHMNKNVDENANTLMRIKKSPYLQLRK